MKTRSRLLTALATLTWALGGCGGDGAAGPGDDGTGGGGGTPADDGGGTGDDGAAGGQGGAGGEGGGFPSGWSAVASGTAKDLNGIDFADAEHGYAVGADQTILVTTDGGKGWQPVTEGFYTSTVNMSSIYANHVLTPSHQYPSYQLLDVHAPSADVAWVSSRGPLKALGSGPPSNVSADQLTGVFVTKDGGKTWTRICMVTNFEIWAVQGFDASTAIAASIGQDDHPDSDVLPITGGASKTRAPVMWGGLRDIFMVDTKLGYTVGADIYKTTNGGAKWSKQTRTGTQQMWRVVFASAERGFIVGDGGLILATADGGMSWTPQKSGVSTRLEGLAFADEMHGFAVGQRGVILATADGGASWTPEPSGTSEDLRTVDALSPTRAWAVGKKGTLLVRN